MSGSRDEQPDDGSAWLPATATAVLEAARERRAIADRAEADLLVLAVQWAIIHPAESLEDAETFRLHGDVPVPVAGVGAPLVAEFSIAEFAAAVGLTTESGRRYVGHALELRYRLKKLWARVTSGDLAAWKARRVAEQTIWLSAEAAKYVDRHVATVAHKIGPAQLDRLIGEAVARFMPDQAEADRKQAWDQRRFDVDFGTVGIAGTCQVSGELDLADAIDLNNAVAADAQVQADLGSVLTLDQRRSVAVGNIARRDLTHDLADNGQDDDHPKPKADKPKGRPREMVLYVHLADAALTGSSMGGATGMSGVGRVENTATPVLAETIRTWCGNPDARITVRPVIDLAQHVHHGAYEIDGRISEPVALRDHTCVFPWCTKPARRLKPGEHAADCDHNLAYAQGGATCTCQIAALCRKHHRLKTHGRWRYLILTPGSYLWTSPHGYHYLRDHTGTLDVSADRHQHRHLRRHPPPAA
jgi:hypothetical protein